LPSIVTIDVASGDPLDLPADTLVVGIFTGGIEGPGAEAVIERLGLQSLPLTPQFRGDIGQHLTLAAPGLRPDTVLFVGLGRMIATDDERLRQAALIAARCGELSGRVVTTLAQVHPSPGAIAAVAEGFRFGAARRRRFATQPETTSPLEHVTILVPSGALDEGMRAVERSAITARAQLAARDLVNTPPNLKPPLELARQFTQLVESTCDATVHDQAAVTRLGLNGLLAVARGAANPPCMVELRYEPEEPLGHVVLCGQGTVFDAGGLTLRDSDAMIETKASMAGAAAIAAACAALAELDVRVRVTALLGITECLPSGDAQRPGDIVTTRGGTTIEVTDPDADAQLMLADLLDLARTYEPDAVVDVATPGDASVAALGRYAGAVMGNDQDLVDALLAAAARSGEALWQLPLWGELDRRLPSAVADVVCNDTKAGGGAIVAGLFLRRFAKDLVWAHIDCSGPAFIPDDLATPARPPGGSGYGVRTLLAWLEHRTAHAD
jgi:leucyl aminopeptidase